MNSLRSIDVETNPPAAFLQSAVRIRFPSTETFSHEGPKLPLHSPLARLHLDTDVGSISLDFISQLAVVVGDAAAQTDTRSNAVLSIVEALSVEVVHATAVDEQVIVASGREASASELVWVGWVVGWS